MSDVDRPAVTRYQNGNVLRDGEIVPGDVWVREGKILDPKKLFYDERRTPDRVVDCKGLIVAPGFIDIQINGERRPVCSLCFSVLLYLYVPVCVCRSLWC